MARQKMSPCGAVPWGFPKMEVPKNGWFIREHPLKMDDLGAPLFLETSKCTKKEVEVQQYVPV